MKIGLPMAKVCTRRHAGEGRGGTGGAKRDEFPFLHFPVAEIEVAMAQGLHVQAHG